MSRKAKRIPDEIFQIKSGRLGPLGPFTFDVRPLTVLVGRQGTGKSLVAQMLYFFRGLPTLVQFDVATHRAAEAEARDPKKVVQRIVDGMRSARRTFARLLMASSLAAGQLKAEIPPETRLGPGDVAAYHLKSDGTVEQLVAEDGTIDERALGRAADALASQMNRIVAARGPT